MHRTATRYRRIAIRLLISGLLLVVLAPHVSTAQAEHPPHWIMGRQHAGSPVQHVHPQGYAYGWFGAQARPQAARQTGYYGLYRQWTFR